MEQLRDPVLRSLMMMGMYDWKGHNTCLHQATQAIHYSSTVMSRLIPQIIDLETKVDLKSHLIMSFFDKSIA